MVTAVMEKDRVRIYKDGHYVTSIYSGYGVETEQKIVHSTIPALSDYPIVTVGNAHLYPDEVKVGSEVE